MMGGFAVMMAYQVASRATRDALFLSNFAPPTLPAMVAVASALSIAAAFGSGRVLSAREPGDAIPAAFAVSGAMMLGEWLVALRWPAAAAVAVYLHVAAIGPVLLSGFWSLLSERFDPRAARREIGRLSAVGTLGGLGGGLLAERSAAWLGVPGTLAVLALMQGACAWSLRSLAPGVRTAAGSNTGAGLSPVEAVRRLARTAYLRNLALLVLGSSVSAALLDYVFKAQVALASPRGHGLMQRFAAFYALVSLLTFVIQALLTRRALERAGLVTSIGALPGAVAAGSVATVLVPGPWSVVGLRALEAILRGSLFRSGCELLGTPIPAVEKRATKALVDVGADRLGDVLGAGLVALVLLFPDTATTRILLVLAAAFSLGTLAIVARLRAGYVASLEAGLRAGVVGLESIEMPEWSAAQTLLGTPGIEGNAPTPGRRAGGTADGPQDTGSPETSAARATRAARVDPGARLVLELRSGDPERVRTALATGLPREPLAVRQALELLAWDDVARDAIRALSAVADPCIALIESALLDPATDFSMRRRIPAVLAGCREPSAARALALGLADPRFEVRYRCGRVLASLVRAGAVPAVEGTLVYEAVRREARLSRTVWRSQQLLEELDEARVEDPLDEFVRMRAGRSLEHVFTLLALVLPHEPLRIAYRGLHTADERLRGLSLEYLESVLPTDVRDLLWPHLEGEAHPRGRPRLAARTRGEILDDLLRSNGSIQLGLAALRHAHSDDPDTSGP